MNDTVILPGDLIVVDGNPHPFQWTLAVAVACEDGLVKTYRPFDEDRERKRYPFQTVALARNVRADDARLADVPTRFSRLAAARTALEPLRGPAPSPDA